jgi:hypothetical protein
MMPNGDEFSRYPSMKGISVDLPFIKFRYVKVDKNSSNEPEEAKPLRISDNSLPSEDTAALNTRRIIYTKQAEVSTMGMDPMVSNASVIHELVYGRSESTSTFTRTSLSYPAASYTAASYPVATVPSSNSLDIFV